MRVRMIGGRVVVVGVLVGGSFVGWTPLEGQHPVDGTDWLPRTLRTHDQPVLPAFEGWYQNPDGTYELCFGYFSANTEEALDIPLGPDNFIEPAEFNGGQPTHFDAVPRAGYRRYYCVFTVNVPEDIGDRDVVWTLRVHGGTYSVPGHVTSDGYRLDDPDAPARAQVWERLLAEPRPPDVEILDLSPGLAQGSVAPVLRFVDPAGTEGRGRTGITAGPVTVAAENPLTLVVSVQESTGRPARWWVGWSKHQGPGEVTFSQREMEADPTTEYRATTRATFSEPGEYVLRVQSIENIRSFERHCCWTNGYVQVSVTR